MKGSYNVVMAIIQTAYAVCPVCTVAVGAGVGFSRWLKIDDTISGVWIGGLIVSLILWTLSWLNKKKFNFTGQGLSITILYYVLTLLPLYKTNIMGHQLNKMWGIDKILLGVIFGSLGFFVGSILYQKIKEKRGKPHFLYQKIVMPVLPLIILTIIFYFLTKTH